MKNTSIYKNPDGFIFLWESYIHFIDNPNNTLINLSSPLLDYILTVASLENSLNPNEFYSYIKNELDLLKNNSALMQINDGSGMDFHFILCDFIDALIKKNKLFKNSILYENLMLEIFYPDEKYDCKLLSIAENYDVESYNSNDLLEFIYICLRLGYKEPYNDEEYAEYIEFCRKIHVSLLKKKTDYPEYKIQKILKKNKYIRKIRILYREHFSPLYTFDPNKRSFNIVNNDQLSVDFIHLFSMLLILVIVSFTLIFGAVTYLIFEIAASIDV